MNISDVHWSALLWSSQGVGAREAYQRARPSMLISRGGVQWLVSHWIGVTSKKVMWWTWLHRWSPLTRIIEIIWCVHCWDATFLLTMGSFHVASWLTVCFRYRFGILCHVLSFWALWNQKFCTTTVVIGTQFMKTLKSAVDLVAWASELCQQASSQELHVTPISWC